MDDLRGAAPGAHIRRAGPLLLAVVTGLAAYAALSFSRIGGGVAGVWPVNGLLAGILLLAPRTRWPAWLVASALGQVAARLWNDNPPLLVAGLVAANLLESWLIAWWVRRHQGQLRDVGSLGQLAKVALAGTVGACMLSGAVALPFLTGNVTTTAGVTWTIWFLAHLLGMVIFATLAVCLPQPNVHLLGPPGRRTDYLACVSLMLAVCAVTFLQNRFPLLFLCYLPLLLLAFRHGLSGMLAGTIALAATSSVALAVNTGPFALMSRESALAHLIFWQAYVACGCLLAYTTSITVTERRRLDRLLQASERRYRALADHLPAMISHFDSQQRFTYANERSRSLDPHGPDPIGRTLREVRGDSIYQSMAPRVAEVLRGKPQNFEGSLWIGGRQLDYRSQFVPDVADDGRVVGFYSLSFDITQAKETERRLASLARNDPLTGLASRRHFNDELDQAINRAARAGAAVMVLALDLDRFKAINDSFGHTVGDEVLREFARRLRSSVYDVDLVGRVGGDEFLVLVEHAASSATGETIARRIVAAMAEPMQLSGQVLGVSTSIGIAVQYPARSASDLLAMADVALYEAKAGGRNQWAQKEG